MDAKHVAAAESCSRTASRLQRIGHIIDRTALSRRAAPPSRCSVSRRAAPPRKSQNLSAPPSALPTRTLDSPHLQMRTQFLSFGSRSRPMGSNVTGMSVSNAGQARFRRFTPSGSCFPVILEHNCTSLGSDRGDPAFFNPRFS
jgi:hypothetical protein